MRQKTRVAITVETRRLQVRRSMTQRQCWCAKCSVYVQVVTLDDAAALMGARMSEIYAQTEAGDYHIVEEAGSIQICLNSLFMSMDKTKP